MKHILKFLIKVFIFCFVNGYLTTKILYNFILFIISIIWDFKGDYKYAKEIIYILSLNGYEEAKNIYIIFYKEFISKK